MEMEAILKLVKFNDWKFKVEERSGNFYLQVHFVDKDLVTRQPSIQHGRKWILSRFMTKSEVVTTAFKAVLTAVEHEVREQFRYRGRMVFGPHFDVDALYEVAHQVDVREEPQSIEHD
jgi:hypothetical protein